MGKTAETLRRKALEPVKWQSAVRWDRDRVGDAACRDAGGVFGICRRSTMEKPLQKDLRYCESVVVWIILVSRGCVGLPDDAIAHTAGI